MRQSGIHAHQPDPDYSDELRGVFIKRVHQLLALGYARLDKRQYCDSHEEAITGDLVQAIEAVYDDPDSPRWMDRFTVIEDPRVNDGKRKGKQRRRVDIRFDSSISRPRQHFSFEAKRLGKHHPVDVYLGSEGLGCFLSGEYAKGDTEAGMLGYVQSGDPPDWAEKISAKITQNSSLYESLADGAFHSIHVVRELKYTYQSKHNRSNVGRRILILHTLLIMN